MSAKPRPAKRQKTSSDPEAPLKDKLYEQCLDHGGIDKVWTAEQLLDLGVTRSQKDLMALCGELMSASLFQAVDTGVNTAAAFRLRSRAAALKYAALHDPDAVEVYRHIENAGTRGIWKLTLKRRTGIHENKVEKILKNLCGSKHIKQLKSIRANAKKTYLLFELEPAKEVTGGAWYTDGDLEDGLIDQIAKIVLVYIKAQSWLPGPRLPTIKNAPRHKARNAPSNPPADSAADVLTPDEARSELRRRVATDKKGRILLPHPPDYDEYPTASEILDKIITTGLVLDKTLTLSDMNELFTRLLWDGRIEPMGTRRRRRASIELDDDDDDDDDNDDDGAEVDEPTYRWVRRPDAWESEASEEDADNDDDQQQHDKSAGPRAAFPGNGFSETPCSRCPVFALCEEGGPVDAKSCAYFEEWF